jgi:Na+-driven multidrug efflux pump
MGRGEKDKAVYFMGNAASSMFICGTILAIFTQIFLVRLVYFFGAPENVAGYAQVYIRITSIGFPFLILATGGGHLIRADGSPKFTMLCNLTGAIINTILDAIFVFGMNQGMAGAALATIIGQFISACMAINYLRNCKSVTLEKKHIRPRSQYVGRVASLGAAPCSNQLAMMVTQIIMNKSLTYYGGLSSYGEEIPLACAGIITKVNQVFFSYYRNVPRLTANHQLQLRCW